MSSLSPLDMEWPYFLNYFLKSKIVLKVLFAQISVHKDLEQVHI